MLPLLRRVFSNFSKSERRQILKLVKSQKVEQISKTVPMDKNMNENRRKVILEGVNKWLG